MMLNWKEGAESGKGRIKLGFNEQSLIEISRVQLWTERGAHYLEESSWTF